MCAVDVSQKLDNATRTDSLYDYDYALHTTFLNHKHCHFILFTDYFKYNCQHHITFLIINIILSVKLTQPTFLPPPSFAF